MDREITFLGKRKDNGDGSMVEVRIWPRKPTGKGGYLCMPLKANVPEGREDWVLVTCPECGAACWRLPLVGELEKAGCIALCTMCALRKGVHA